MRCGLFHESREKKEGSSKMSNAYAETALRNQSPETNAVEDVTEKIQRLCVTADNEHIPQINFPDLVVSNDDDKCKEEKNAEEKEENVENVENVEKKVEEETEDETNEEDESDDNDEDDDDDDDDDEGDENLIERGPMKSHVFSSPRDPPYTTNFDQNLFGRRNERELREYTKSVEKINKSCCTVESNEIGSQVYDSKDEFIPLSPTDVNDLSEYLLMENVLNGTFQAAQRSSNNENRESSGLAYSPPSTISTDSLWPTTGSQNFNQGSLDSSPVTNDDSNCEQRRLSLTNKTFETIFDPPINALEPSVYRPTQLSSCSSSYSSSSSNQSYGDAASPYTYQMPYTPLVDKQINKHFEKFSIQKQQDTTESTDEIYNIGNPELLMKVCQELLNYCEGGKNVEVDGTREEFSVLTGINYEQTNPEELAVNFSPCPSDVSFPDLNSLLNSPSNVSSSSTIVADANLNIFETIKPTNTTDDSRIPKMVASFESCHRRQRNTTPWPSLNLPSVTASDRLKEQVNPKEVEKAMMNLLKRPVEELAKQDEDGDTMLMCLVGNPEEFARKKAYLAPLVERLSTMKGALATTNNRGEDALYFAAINCPRFPYVTGYLAAAMLQKNIDVSQRLYRTRGYSLIHSVAEQGDSHIEVLAELLALRTNQGNAVFDLSKRNYDGKTALHVAIGNSSLAIVKMLLKHGADPRTKETERGDTALHIAASRACDPALVKGARSTGTVGRVRFRIGERDQLRSRHAVARGCERVEQRAAEPTNGSLLAVDSRRREQESAESSREKPVRPGPPG
ncbi:SRP-independent targeting protein 1-like isoform X2 [Osmia bicornis bicornis]|uniref:SRP-independent targeting protein 1-like isoform X2 n=1 Tax=Osmia bicornis bicornis TaxID=1437191 RepID=UPI001EAF0914|nr:SRP-independent targeting protein 1-like isoform X2 [Osmia bicornis bicornis]